MATKNKKIAKAGSGSLRRRDNGSFEYRVRYTDLYGESKCKSFSGQSVEACEEKAKQFFERLEKERMGVDLRMTIPRIARIKADKNFANNFTQEQTYRRNLETIKIIEKTPLGSVPIIDVTPKMLESFLVSLKRYANTTIQKVFQIVKSAFIWAKENRIIDVNIITANNIRCPRSDKRDKVVESLSVEDQKKLIEYLNTYQPYAYRNCYKLQLMIEMYSGLRMGEINALRLQDIDLKKNVICVHGTITRGLEYEIYRNDSTKTETGIRQVPIMKSLLPYLEEAIAQYRKNKACLLFYDHVHKKMITTEQVNCFYKRICEKLGIQSAGQHCLRHTFATRCIEAGVEAVVLKNWMGHTNIHVTLDTYADVFASMHNSSINTFTEYMNGMI